MVNDVEDDNDDDDSFFLLLLHVYIKVNLNNKTSMLCA